VTLSTTSLKNTFLFGEMHIVMILCTERWKKLDKKGGNKQLDLKDGDKNDLIRSIIS
jgi:hypothetical protein